MDRRQLARKVAADDDAELKQAAWRRVMEAGRAQNKAGKKHGEKEGEELSLIVLGSDTVVQRQDN